jgi:hypothetical protein
MTKPPCFVERRQQSSSRSQENYLKAVLDYHPDSSAAAEATKKSPRSPKMKTMACA